MSSVLNVELLSRAFVGIDAVTRSLNILILAACTSHKGGLEVMSLQVAEELKRRGHNIFCSCLSG